MEVRLRAVSGLGDAAVLFDSSKIYPMVMHGITHPEAVTSMGPSSKLSRPGQFPVTSCVRTPIFFCSLPAVGATALLALRQPPSPPEVLGLGHMIPMTTALASGVPFESLMLKWRQEYGPFFEFRLPGSPAVVLVADPEAIKEVRIALPAPADPLGNTFLQCLNIVMHGAWLRQPGSSCARPNLSQHSRSLSFGRSHMCLALVGWLLMLQRHHHRLDKLFVPNQLLCYFA